MAAGLSLSHTELGLASTAGLNLQMSINLRSTLESNSPLHHLLEGSWGKGGGGGSVSGCAGMDLEAAEVHVVLSEQTRGLSLLNTNY